MGKFCFKMVKLFFFSYIHLSTFIIELHPDKDDIFVLAPAKYDLVWRSVQYPWNGLTDLVCRKPLGYWRTAGVLDLSNICTIMNLT